MLCYICHTSSPSRPPGPPPPEATADKPASLRDAGFAARRVPCGRALGAGMRLLLCSCGSFRIFIDLLIYTRFTSHAHDGQPSTATASHHSHSATAQEEKEADLFYLPRSATPTPSTFEVLSVICTVYFDIRLLGS